MVGMPRTNTHTHTKKNPFAVLTSLEGVFPLIMVYCKLPDLKKVLRDLDWIVYVEDTRRSVRPLRRGEARGSGWPVVLWLSDTSSSTAQV